MNGVELADRFIARRDEVLYRFLAAYPMDLSLEERVRLLDALACAVSALEDDDA